MKGMTGQVEHAGKTFSWWAGSADHEGEWCVHCRHESYGLSQYLQDQPSEDEAQQLAQRLAPLVEAVEQDPYSG